MTGYQCAATVFDQCVERHAGALHPPRMSEALAHMSSVRGEVPGAWHLGCRCCLAGHRFAITPSVGQMKVAR